MRVLVCGSRDYVDSDVVMHSLLSGLMGYSNDLLCELVVIEGGAKGADRAAETWFEYVATTAPWATPEHVQHEQYPAAWGEHHPDWCPGDWCRKRSYCVGAGPRRNQQMLDEGQPQLVVAFKDQFNWKLDKGGTEDMVKRAKAAGVPTYVVSRA